MVYTGQSLLFIGILEHISTRHSGSNKMTIEQLCEYNGGNGAVPNNITLVVPDDISPPADQEQTEQL